MIKKTIGANYNAEGEDVLRVKSLLNNHGFYEIPSYGLTPYPDGELFRSIKSFQENMGLKVSGVIRPEDKTDKFLDKLLGIPGVKGPILRCTECGGPHGGSKGDLCPDCDIKK